jgi:polyisoprenoid-binding protein YceI
VAGAIAIGLAGLATTLAVAEPRLYVVEPERSAIRFHAVSRLMDADGRFARFGGEVRVEPSQWESAAVRLTVDVASLDTGIRRRDNHLRSDDFFDVERYPQAVFESTAVRAEGERLTVSGRLTIHGVTRPLTVPVTVTQTAAGLRVVGELTLKRFEFGIAYQSRLNPIQDEVKVRFDLMAVPR